MFLPLIPLLFLFGTAFAQSPSFDNTLPITISPPSYRLSGADVTFDVSWSGDLGRASASIGTYFIRLYRGATLRTGVAISRSEFLSGSKSWSFKLESGFGEGHFIVIEGVAGTNSYGSVGPGFTLQRSGSGGSQPAPPPSPTPTPSPEPSPLPPPPPEDTDEPDEPNDQPNPIPAPPPSPSPQPPAPIPTEDSDPEELGPTETPDQTEGGIRTTPTPTPNDTEDGDDDEIITDTANVPVGALPTTFLSSTPASLPLSFTSTNSLIPTTTPPPSTSGTSNGKLPTGILAGIIAGVLGLLLLFTLILLAALRGRSRARQYDSNNSRSGPSNGLETYGDLGERRRASIMPLSGALFGKEGKKESKVVSGSSWATGTQTAQELPSWSTGRGEEYRNTQLRGGAGTPNVDYMPLGTGTTGTDDGAPRAEMGGAVEMGGDERWPAELEARESGSHIAGWKARGGDDIEAIAGRETSPGPPGGGYMMTNLRDSGGYRSSTVPSGTDSATAGSTASPMAPHGFVDDRGRIRDSVDIVSPMSPRHGHGRQFSS